MYWMGIGYTVSIEISLQGVVYGESSKNFL